MDFLNHSEAGMVSFRFSSFLLYINSKRLHYFEKYISQGKAVEVTANNKEENCEDFCLDFVQEFGLWYGYVYLYGTDTRRSKYVQGCHKYLHHCTVGPGLLKPSL